MDSYKLKKGDTVAGYRLGNVLGGRSGTVYKVGRANTIKIIQGKNNLEQFLKQKEVFDRLKNLDEHPNIVRVLDYGLDDRGFGFIVNPYMRNGSVEDIIRDLNPERSLAIIIDVLKGSGFLHANGILHCDTHPGNILFDGKSNPKLNDFELAVLVKHYSVEEKKIRKHYSVEYAAEEKLLGCKDYIAPWVASRETNSDVHSEVYMATATLYHMLLGQPRKKSFDDPLPSKTMGRNYRFLDEILVTGMNTDLKMSYKSSDEMRQALIKAKEKISKRTVRARAKLSSNTTYPVPDLGISGINSARDKLFEGIKNMPFDRDLGVTPEQGVKDILENYSKLKNFEHGKKGQAPEGLEALTLIEEANEIILERLGHDYGVMKRFGIWKGFRYLGRTKPGRVKEKAESYKSIMETWKNAPSPFKEEAIKLFSTEVNTGLVGVIREWVKV
jgi:serine/threonine protein kinase